LIQQKEKAKNTDEIFHEELETSEGTMVVSANRRTILQNIESYHQKLLHSRGVPMNLETINPKDPRLTVVAKLPWLKSPRDQKAYLTNYYEVEHTKAQREAALLAMFANQQNVLTFEPAPYPLDAVLPGMEDELPSIRRNLAIPLERRLKQIMDLIEDPEVYARVMAMMERIVASIEGGGDTETDEDGFQPSATG
jgi:hypothetical protein